MTTKLRKLLDEAKAIVLTPEDKEEQRRSFAYGNVSIENPRVTREIIDREAGLLASIDYRRSEQ